MSKTVKVSEILEFANEQLSRKDEEATQGFKAGVCSMIQKILFLSNNYEGFQFLPWLEGGYERWMEAGQPEDETKDDFVRNDKEGYYSRYYYKSSKEFFV